MGLLSREQLGKQTKNSSQKEFCSTKLKMHFIPESLAISTKSYTKEFYLQKATRNLFYPSNTSRGSSFIEESKDISSIKNSETHLFIAVPKRPKSLLFQKTPDLLLIENFKRYTFH